MFVPLCFSVFSSTRGHPEVGGWGQVFRDFKDTVYPLFESDTLFLEGLFVLFVVV